MTGNKLAFWIDRLKMANNQEYLLGRTKKVERTMVRYKDGWFVRERYPDGGVSVHEYLSDIKVLKDIYQTLDEVSREFLQDPHGQEV